MDWREARLNIGCARLNKLTISIERNNERYFGRITLRRLGRLTCVLGAGLNVVTGK